MKRRSSSKPADRLFSNGPLFSNDPETRRTERAILRPLNPNILGSSDEGPVFLLKYYRDTAAPSSSGERVMFIRPEELNALCRRASKVINVEALSLLVAFDQFLEDEYTARERDLAKANARQR